MYYLDVKFVKIIVLQNGKKKIIKKKCEREGIPLDIPEDSKWCTGCKKVHKLTKFGTRQKKTGIFYKSRCKEFERLDKLERDRENGVQPKKKTRVCRKCKNQVESILVNDKFKILFQEIRVHYYKKLMNIE